MPNTLLTIPKRAAPSYKAGYARSAAESAHPELWDGLRIAWIPSLGIQGRKLVNQAGGGNDILFNAALPTSSWGLDETGHYLTFDGSADNDLETTDSPLQDDFDQFTIITRAKSSSHVSWLGMFGRDRVDADGTIAIMNNGSVDQFKFHVNGVTDTSIINVTHADLNNDVWTSIAGVRNASNSHAVYVNGNEAGSGTVDTGSILASGVNWSIGRVVGNEWNGDIAECYFYNRVLSPQEIKLLHADPLAPFRLRELNLAYNFVTPPVVHSLIHGAVPQRSNPSYKTGHARNATESAHPELWEGMLLQQPYFLGDTGLNKPDLAPLGEHYGTAEGVFATAPSPLGPALDCNAADALNISVNKRVKNLEAVTSVAYFKYRGNANTQIMSMLGTSNDGRYFLGAGDNVTFWWDQSGTSLTGPDLVDTGTTDQWHCVAFRASVEKGMIDCYWNGKFYSSIARTLTTMTIGTGASIASDIDVRWYSNSIIGYIGAWDRWLSDEEVQRVTADPAAPFRLKPKTLAHVPAPVVPSHSLIHVPRRAEPSYKAGYAHNAAESAYPELWRDAEMLLPFGMNNGVSNVVSPHRSDRGVLRVESNVVWINTDGGPAISSTSTSPTTDQVEITAAEGVYDSSEYTIIAVVMCPSSQAGTQQHIWSHQNGNQALFKNSANNFRFTAHDGTTGRAATTSETYADDKVHVVAGRCYDNGDRIIHVDGIIKQTTAAGSLGATWEPYTSARRTMLLCLRDNTGGSNFVDGGLIAFYQWSRALSDDEIRQFTNNYFAPFRLKPRALSYEPKIVVPSSMMSVPRRAAPSYKAGYARGAAESANPGLWDGLVGAWVPGLGVSGGTLRDVSGNKNDGTLTNMDPGTDWVVGEKGYALDFDGVDDYVSAPATAFTEVTTVVGFRCSSNDNALFEMAELPGNSTLDRALYLSTTNHINAYIYDGGFKYAIGTIPVSLNEWHTAALTADGVNLNVYLDGDKDTSIAAGSPYMGYATPEWVISRSDTLTSLTAGYGNADISFALVYSKALTPNEIQHLHQDPLAPFRLKDRVVPHAPLDIKAALSGSITQTVNEDDLVAGGKKIILDLARDTWLPL